MGSPKDYHFQLKDTERKLCETWKEIQRKSEFHDVTLACDGNEIKAHKVIICSFSPVLQKLLTSNYHQHPLIYLRGIRHSVLVSILDFIYKGEVSIRQDTIQEFLSVAHDLKIKGLAEEDRGEEINVNISEPNFFSNYTGFDNSINPVSNNQDTIEFREAIEVKYNIESLRISSNEENVTEELENLDDSSEVNETKGKLNLLQFNCSEDSASEKDETQNILETEKKPPVQFVKNESKTIMIKSEEPKRRIKKTKLLKKEENDLMKFPCKNCNYVANFKSNLKKHMNLKHLGIQFSCEKCDFSVNTQNNLKQHIDSKHLGMQYDCNFCDHTTTNRGNLKKHIASQHEGIRYSCDKCEQSYAQKYHLVEHIKSKHEGFRYTCTFCNNSYIDKGNLKKHKVSQHKEEYTFGVSQNIHNNME